MKKPRKSTRKAAQKKVPQKADLASFITALRSNKVPRQTRSRLEDLPVVHYQVDAHTPPGSYGLFNAMMGPWAFARYCGKEAVEDIVLPEVPAAAHDTLRKLTKVIVDKLMPFVEKKVHELRSRIHDASHRPRQTWGA